MMLHRSMVALGLFLVALAGWPAPAAANDPMSYVKALIRGAPGDEAFVEAFPTYLRTERTWNDISQIEEFRLKGQGVRQRYGEPRITYRTETWLFIAVPARSDETGNFEQPLFSRFKKGKGEKEWQFRGYTDHFYPAKQAELLQDAEKVIAAGSCEPFTEVSFSIIRDNPFCVRMARTLKILSSDAQLGAWLKAQRQDINSLASLFKSQHIPKYRVQTIPNMDIIRGVPKPPLATDGAFHELSGKAAALGIFSIRNLEKGILLDMPPGSMVPSSGLLNSTLWFVGNAGPAEIDAIIDAWNIDNLEGITDLGDGWLHVRTNDE